MYSRYQKLTYEYETTNLQFIWDSGEKRLSLLYQKFMLKNIPHTSCIYTEYSQVHISLHSIFV